MAHITRRGIWYWPTFEEARDYATEHNHPTNRIIPYKLGWAIQLYVSGPYVGPCNHNEGEVDYSDQDLCYEEPVSWADDFEDSNWYSNQH